MSKMLLSIKPEYVEKILSGQKRYEFRKFHCRPDIDTIIIYSTSPVKQVVAEVKMIGILEGNLSEIWQKTKDLAGLSETMFFAYYKNKEKATAYQLGEVTVYDTPKTLSDYGLSYTPQSFAYIKTRLPKVHNQPSY